MVQVLVADDVPENLKLLSLCLQGEGYEVVTATNGQEAIDVARRESPSAILLDVMMPVMDGIEACRRIKGDDQLRDVPIILVTALDHDDDVIRGLDAGADDYVTKPISRSVIAARTRSAVKRYQMISENRRLMQALEGLATTDPLTGLLNRRTFLEHFARELKLARRHDHPLACVLVDVDFFKKVNDDFGHSVGDDALRSVAAMLKTHVRATDFVCRYGGEEFAVLLPMADEADAVVWADRARCEVASLEIPADNRRLKITASFGAAGLCDDSLLPDDVVEAADEALLVAKRSGRNRVIAHSTLDDAESLASVGRQGHHPVLQHTSARDVMTSPISCVQQDARLSEAADLLLGLGINSAPVVDQFGRLVGIISEKDVMVASSHGELAERRVADHMFANVVQFQETDSAETVYRFLCRNTIRRVVVVADGQPIGVISRGDLLRWIVRQSSACCV